MASYGTYDDAALLLQLKQGDDHSDQSAFREIYDRYMEKLYRSACRKLASPEQGGRDRARRTAGSLEQKSRAGY